MIVERVYPEWGRGKCKSSWERKTEELLQQFMLADTIFYYTITRRNYNFTGILTSTTTITFFSTNERLVSSHRVSQLNMFRRGTSDPPPTEWERPTSVEVIRTLDLTGHFIWRRVHGAYTDIRIAAVSSRPRPAMVPRNLGIDRVDRWDWAF